jgi:LemA protein
MIGVYIAIGIVGILLVILALIYNRLVNMHNQMKTLWAQVDPQLKRRYDPIPNLIETVKGYAQHERGTFEAVTIARKQAEAASNSGAVARAKAKSELNGHEVQQPESTVPLECRGSYVQFP